MPFAGTLSTTALYHSTCQAVCKVLLQVPYGGPTAISFTACKERFRLLLRDILIHDIELLCEKIALKLVIDCFTVNVVPALEFLADKLSLFESLLKGGATEQFS